MPVPRMLAVALSLLVGAAPAFAEALTVTHATLIDGNGGPVQADMAVVIREGRIAAIGPSRTTTAGGQVIDLQGRALLPGLIDAHTHITSPAAAKRALTSGVTTARVLGDTHWQAMGTRDLIREGFIDGPELLAAGPLIRPKPGEAFYVDLPQLGAFIGKPLQGPASVAAATRAILSRGADVIKIGVNERAGTAATDPLKPELLYPEIQAVVAEASKAGRAVAAHAYTDAGAGAAVAAGVRTIEHGAYLTDATLIPMQKQGTFLVPTMQALSSFSQSAPRNADDLTVALRLNSTGPRICAVVRRAKALGIPLVAATDGSYGDTDETAGFRLVQDMERMIGCGGLTALEAITAATRTAAQALQIDRRTGTIAVGKEADLLAVEGNPLEQFSVFYDPVLVLTNGRVVLNRLYDKLPGG